MLDDPRVAHGGLRPFVEVFYERRCRAGRASGASEARRWSPTAGLEDSTRPTRVRPSAKHGEICRAGRARGASEARRWRRTAGLARSARSTRPTKTALIPFGAAEVRVRIRLAPIPGIFA